MEIIESNIDLNAYKTFYAVAKYESFSKAANELCISQPAVSYSIKKLEEELNTKLFIRLNKGIKLTDAGEKLKFYVENAFNNIIAGYKELSEKEEQQLSGEITIGVHSNVGTFLLPKIIKKFTIKHPKSKINIYNSTTKEMKEMFNKHQIDILILHFPIFDSTNGNIYEEKLLTCDSCFFGIKKFYDSFKLSKKQNIISEYPLLLPLKGFTTSNSLEKVFKNHNVILSSNIYLYTTEMTVGLVKEGIGVGWTLKNCIQNELDNNELYEIPIEMDLPKIEFSIAYDKKTINKTALEFASQIIKETKKQK